MDWLRVAQTLRDRREGHVIVTLATVRGHSPRDGGAKMVVSRGESWGTIGGGNLEATAIDRARAMLESDAAVPELMTLNLSDKAPAEYGVQCCGGEVTMLLEPMRAGQSIVIFGMGHVGYELARILSRHDVSLALVDSREDAVAAERLAVLDDGPASITAHHAAVPESVLRTLPENTHVLIMTHDHAEDLALCDLALRTPGIASIGLIGSSAKWARFRTKLAEAGHSADEIGRIQTPIGIDSIRAKEPAAIAVSVAAGLLSDV
ncbi:xanthine dehydrogenase accessory protein XdhC [Paramicrobacterium agarici]|uniref:xanthine dehydrogenase accessory protein XdhC n=1 Tax=Paramicrobacterium agarici TaxID=630514 RepID=UPI001153A6CC|nr:xanthine dehydrogenase accessory protein XdhC [Microbacterium agarici]TQO22123.1 molybdenum cofactor sulfurylase [Microbacterium agarici]